MPLAGLSYWAMITAVAVAAPSGGPASGPPACDPETTRNARHLGKAAYGPRGDESNPYCEGKVAQKVANAGRRVEVVECVLGPRPGAIGDKVSWVFCWPFTDARVEMHGRHGGSNVFYRLDGEEPDQKPDLGKPNDAKDPARDEFTWNTAVLAEAGYNAADMFVGVFAVAPENAPEGGAFGRLAAGTPVLLPATCNVQGAARAAAKPELMISLLVQGEALRVNSVSLRRIGESKGEAIMLERGRFSPRLNPDQHGWLRVPIGGDGPAADGGVYRVELSTQTGRDNAPAEKVMFHIRMPTAEFVEWATHAG